MSRVVIAGSFDTKAEPLGLLIRLLRDRDEDPVVIDTSVFAGDPAATYPASVVAERAGMSHGDLPSLGRADAVAAMSRGTAAILSELHERREVGALVCMGGSNAASVFSALVPSLPLGIPKIVMATSVAGDTRPIVGGSDVVMFYPVVDVDGHNPILRRMIERVAATAVVLKSASPLSDAPKTRPLVALTMYGVTTPCVQRVARLLGEAGVEPLVFHANGVGGRSVEAFARHGVIDAVVDATLAEVSNDVVGGAFGAGPDRGSAVAAAGLPQVIAPGAIDTIAFGPRHTVPERFNDHAILAHNELVTLVRTTPDECRAIGRSLAERLGKPRGPVVVCIPLGGTSMLDTENGAFHDPRAVRAFRDGLMAAADGRIEIKESPHNIIDPEFADLMVSELNRIMDIPRSEKGVSEGFST
ncbi:MAG: Tm-1-like ATP-binding domain-containing protein [Bauldia sp.]|uniref:Tm-1-like ATP-binding domain-containing protein n=1 Tax=Bauldia sp. TaxID=2575872 RepID=UPI001D642798|nr:Tm-1-like ATP-binding domain-containing protein [Bauldia sp.]MCB1494332.1 Tm-1-like ATP-binding domain-containing protein [Bauldia sp.]